MNKISRLKKYQFEKFGKCLSCKEPIPADSCIIQCPNCGYADNWNELPIYLEDKGENDDEGEIDNKENRKIGKFTCEACVE